MHEKGKLPYSDRAYQNQLITKLKIESNPFAKGFRDTPILKDFRLNKLDHHHNMNSRKDKRENTEAIANIMSAIKKMKKNQIL